MSTSWDVECQRVGGVFSCSNEFRSHGRRPTFILTTYKVIIGSLDGMLRMYYPRKREFRVDDLILEQMLPAAILELAVGRFVSGSQELCLGVLLRVR